VILAAVMRYISLVGHHPRRAVPLPVVLACALDVVVEFFVDQLVSALRVWAGTTWLVISPIDEVLTCNRAGAVEIEQVLGSQCEMWAPIARRLTPPFRSAAGRAVQCRRECRSRADQLGGGPQLVQLFLVQATRLRFALSQNEATVTQDLLPTTATATGTSLIVELVRPPIRVVHVYRAARLTGAETSALPL
jgi:hypothetical protein